MNNKNKKLLENYLYKLLKEEFDNSNINNGSFFQEKKSDNDKNTSSNEKETEKKEFLTLSDYQDLDQDTYGKLKTIVPVLTSTYNDEVNTYNLTHSQLAYEMYPSLDADTARSKFSQKVTGKKRFTGKEINKLFNIVSGKIA